MRPIHSAGQTRLYCRRLYKCVLLTLLRARVIAEALLRASPARRTRHFHQPNLSPLSAARCSCLCISAPQVRISITSTTVEHLNDHCPRGRTDWTRFFFVSPLGFYRFIFHRFFSVVVPLTSHDEIEVLPTPYHPKTIAFFFLLFFIISVQHSLTTGTPEISHDIHNISTITPIPRIPYRDTC